MSDITQMVDRKLEMHAAYHLRVRVECREASAPAPSRRTYSAELWRDGDKFRIDLSDADCEPPPPAGLSQPGGHGTRHITCTNCERQGHVIDTTVQPGKPAILSLVEFHTTNAMSPEYTTLNIDWRFLGLCNTRLAGYQFISIAKSYLELAANPGLAVSARPRGTVLCTVAALTSSDRQFEVWFADAQRFNPVLHTVVHGKADQRVATTTEVSWQTTAGGHLYPSSVRYSQSLGNRVQTEEVVTVLEADFHNPVDPVAFTLAGFGLNNNQRIGLPGVPPGDQPRWRDGKADSSLSARAVAESEAAAHPAVVPGPLAPYPGGDGALLYVGVASGMVAFAALAGALVRRVRRRGA